MYHHVYGWAKEFLIWMLAENPLDVAEERGVSLVFLRKRRVRFTCLFLGGFFLFLSLYILRNAGEDWKDPTILIYVLCSLSVGAFGFYFASGEITLEPDCLRKQIPGRIREIPWSEVVDIYDAIEGNGLAVVGKAATIAIDQTFSTPERFYVELFSRSGLSRKRPFSPRNIFVQS